MFLPLLFLLLVLLFLPLAALALALRNAAGTLGGVLPAAARFRARFIFLQSGHGAPVKASARSKKPTRWAVAGYDCAVTRVRHKDDRPLNVK